MEGERRERGIERETRDAARQIQREESDMCAHVHHHVPLAQLEGRRACRLAGRQEPVEAAGGHLCGDMLRRATAR